MTHAIPQADELLATALAEDLGVPSARILRPQPGGAGLLERDVTTASTVPRDAVFSGRIAAREGGVVCGLPLVARTFELLAVAAACEPVECFPLVAEGAHAAPGTAVMEVDGPARVVLAAERSALNLLMVLSGIASEARRWHRAAGERLVVTDTRKTLPGLRALSKYAVRVGGGYNHRAGLYDMVLIKDNHIAYAGGVRAAIAAAMRSHPGLPVECEADTVEQAAEAARAGADLVLLDNMDDRTLAAAVAAVRGAAAPRRCLTEASGGIVLERLEALAGTGVDRVSTSALTFARPLDFGLDAE